MANRFKNALAKAKESGLRSARKAKANRADLERKGAALATAFGIGRSKDAEWFQAIPKPFGVPRTAVVAGAALFLSGKVKGDMGNLLEGIGTGAGCVAAYQWGAREEVSGGRASERSLRRSIERQLSTGMDDDDDAVGYEEDVVAV